MTQDVRWLARELAKLETKMRDKGSTPQLGTSSIEDGTILSKEQGQLRGAVGKQFDGTNTNVDFNGPIPPTPSAPVITASDEITAVIHWDGTWVDAAVPPLDLARIDVHVVADPETDPLTTPSVASVAAAGWGDVLLPLPPGTYYAFLVAWTTSGQYAASAPSEAFATAVPEVSPTDGEPPSESPIPTTVPGLRQVFVKWVQIANPDPVTSEVHVATSSGSPAPTPGDASTLVGSTPASMMSVSTLADGTPLEYDTEYYFAVIATDADGAADPSPWVAGQMDRTANGDLVADAIDGMTITGAVVRTASAGQRVQMDTEGLKSYNSSNVETARLSAATGGLDLTGLLYVLGEIATRRTVDDTELHITDGGLTWTDPENPVYGDARVYQEDGSLVIDAGLDLILRSGSVFQLQPGGDWNLSDYLGWNSDDGYWMKTATEALTLVGGSPFDLNTLSVTRINSLVVLNGGLRRPSGSSGATYVDVAEIPDGFKPTAAVPMLNSAFYNVAETYQFTVTSGGMLQQRQTGARAFQMSASAIWFTGDAFP